MIVSISPTVSTCRCPFPRIVNTPFAQLFYQWNSTQTYGEENGSFCGIQGVVHLWIRCPRIHLLSIDVGVTPVHLHCNKLERKMKKQSKVKCWQWVNLNITKIHSPRGISVCILLIMSITARNIVLSSSIAACPVTSACVETKFETQFVNIIGEGFHSWIDQSEVKEIYRLKERNQYLYDLICGRILWIVVYCFHKKKRRIQSRNLFREIPNRKLNWL